MVFVCLLVTAVWKPYNGAVSSFLPMNAKAAGVWEAGPPVRAVVSANGPCAACCRYVHTSIGLLSACVYVVVCLFVCFVRVRLPRTDGRVGLAVPKQQVGGSSDVADSGLAATAVWPRRPSRGPRKASLWFVCDAWQACCIGWFVLWPPPAGAQRTSGTHSDVACTSSPSLLRFTTSKPKFPGWRSRGSLFSFVKRRMAASRSS